MIFLYGLGLILLISCLCHARDAQTLFEWMIGGTIGIAMIVMVIAFMNELNRDHLRDAPKVILTLGE